MCYFNHVKSITLTTALHLHFSSYYFLSFIATEEEEVAGLWQVDLFVDRAV